MFGEETTDPALRAFVEECRERLIERETSGELRFIVITEDDGDVREHFLRPTPPPSPVS